MDSSANRRTSPRCSFDRRKKSRVSREDFATPPVLRAKKISVMNDGTADRGAGRKCER